MVLIAPPSDFGAWHSRARRARPSLRLAGGAAQSRQVEPRSAGSPQCDGSGVPQPRSSGSGLRALPKGRGAEAGLRLENGIDEAHLEGANPETVPPRVRIRVPLW